MTHYDRFGDPIEPEPTGHRCDNGWRGEDDQGRPRPCYVCKPDLRPERRRWRAGITDQRPEGER